MVITLFFWKKSKTPQKKRNLIAKTNPRSAVSEQYRTLRTNIQFADIDGNLRSIVVTSTEPGEGKSTTIANLAVTFANQGQKVLLIDADLRIPTAHYTFNLQGATGLTNVLSRNKTFEEVVCDTEIENLSVLPCGPIPPNPSELLASSGMKEFLKEMEGLYDIVLIDSPPVLAVADAQILANICSGSILVISHNKTEIDKIQKAKDILNSAKGKLLGAVLNNKKANSGDNYGYYGTYGAV